MNKIKFLVVCFFLKVYLINAQERPNIIFLFSDDQTINTLGAYGNTDVITPNLDKLSNMGVRFTNHYNTTSICMASRASVMTGMYEYRHGTNFQHGDLDKKIFDESYTSKLREAGYYTGIVGKIGFMLENLTIDDFNQEFDEFASGPGQTFYETALNKPLVKYAKKYPHASRSNGAWAVDFMKNAKAAGKPFCMSVSFKAPHAPTTPDPIDLKRYEGIKTFSKPANYGVENGEHLSKQAHTSRAAKNYRYWMTDYDKTVRDYYACISGVDAAVGMIVEGLKEQGLEKNTIIIFTSDNGYNCGAHGFTDKVLPYEEGSKSPLIIYDPRLPKKYAGKVSHALTANVDMTATIFDFSGVEAPKDMDGLSLIPLLKNPESKVREALPLFNFWGESSAHSMAIVTEQWKYVYWFSGDNGMTPTEELFDLGKNRLEMKNVISDNSKVLKKVKNYYRDELKAIKEKAYLGHGYEDYATISDQQIAWLVKKPLVEEIDRKNRIAAKAAKAERIKKEEKEKNKKMH